MNALGYYVDGRIKAHACPDHFDSAIADGDAPVRPIFGKGDGIVIIELRRHAVDLYVPAGLPPRRTRAPQILSIGIGNMQCPAIPALFVEAIYQVTAFRRARITRFPLGPLGVGAQRDGKGAERISRAHQHELALRFDDDNAERIAAFGPTFGPGWPRRKHDAAQQRAADHPAVKQGKPRYRPVLPKSIR